MVKAIALYAEDEPQLVDLPMNGSMINYKKLYGENVEIEFSAIARDLIMICDCNEFYKPSVDRVWNVSYLEITGNIIYGDIYIYREDDDGMQDCTRADIDDLKNIFRRDKQRRREYLTDCGF
jgi:hypothetical protein